MDSEALSPQPSAPHIRFALLPTILISIFIQTACGATPETTDDTGGAGAPQQTSQYPLPPEDPASRLPPHLKTALGRDEGSAEQTTADRDQSPRATGKPFPPTKEWEEMGLVGVALGEDGKQEFVSLKKSQVQHAKEAPPFVGENLNSDGSTDQTLSGALEGSKEVGLIIGSEDRMFTWSNLGYPARTTVTLFISFDNQLTWAACSGTMVGARTVLTASHCFYKQGTNQVATNITAVPALRYDYMPFGNAKASSIWWDPGYPSSGNDFWQFDIGFVQLDRRLGDHTGYLGAWEPNDYTLLSGTVGLSAYPGDLPTANVVDPRYQAVSTWGDGVVSGTDLSPLGFRHTCDLTPGASGGGLTHWSDTERLVGVQSSINAELGLHGATRFAQNRSGWILTMRSQAEGLPLFEPNHGAPWRDLGGSMVMPAFATRHGNTDWVSLFSVAKETNEVHWKLVRSDSSLAFWPSQTAWYELDDNPSGPPASDHRSEFAVASASNDSCVVHLAALTFDGTPWSTLRTKKRAGCSASTASWLPWQTLATPVGITQAPTLLARKNLVDVDLFVVGQDGVVYHNWRTNSVDWLGWANLGAPPGGAATKVAAISRSEGLIDLYVTAGDGRIYGRSWTGAAWWPATSWWPIESSGITADAPPVACAWPSGDIFVFGALANPGSDPTTYPYYIRYQPGSGWQPLVQINNPSADYGTGSVGLSCRNTGALNVFARQTHGAVWTKWFDGTNWGPSLWGWQDFGSDMLESPTVVDHGNRIDIFSRGRDLRVWHRRWDGSQWN